jgi:phosphoglycerol geranylgeranyltransferase
VSEALDEFDPGAEVDRDRLGEWVEETVDVEETSAVQYLSTIPELPEPEARATRYLATGIETVLAIEGIAAELEDPTPAAIREAVDESVPGEDALADVLDGDTAPVARQIAVGLLADRFDLSAEDSFVGRHIGVDF